MILGNLDISLLLGLRLSGSSKTSIFHGVLQHAKNREQIKTVHQSMNLLLLQGLGAMVGM